MIGVIEGIKEMIDEILIFDVYSSRSVPKVSSSASAGK